MAWLYDEGLVKEWKSLLVSVWMRMASASLAQLIPQPGTC